MYYKPVTINDVAEVLEPLKKIKRPDGDNEGDPINAPNVYNLLSNKEQEQVDCAENVLMRYTRDSGDQPNQRALTELYKQGFPSELSWSQYNSDLLIGDVKIGNWILDISDEVVEEDNDCADK